MNEHFLHFVWKNGLFRRTDLKTVCRDKIEIIDPGIYNRDAGPDFLNSRIMIGDMEWAGNVEIHYRSSSWYEHKHHLDRAYNNVILHVVINHDRDVITEGGHNLQTLILDIAPGVIGRYDNYMRNESVIACRKDLYSVDYFFIRHWIAKLAIERLEKKTLRISDLLDQTSYNWEEVLYKLLAGNFGMNVNRDPFYQLASKVPLKLIRKHSDNLIQVEALLFGQAGFLNPAVVDYAESDNYLKLLRREYQVLKSKYRLASLDPSIWKFHRMRPANFPTRRISQLAFLMARRSGLFRSILEALSKEEIIAILNTETSEYWHNHYRFGKIASGIPPGIGKGLIDNLLINSIVPLLWLYGKIQDEELFCDRAIDISDSIKPELNRTTKEWIKSGVKPGSSFESQGLLELTSSYCKNRKCLNCHIGTKLISLGRELDPESSLILGEPV